MIARVCPKCKASLGEFDHYFCSACGEKIPDKLIVAPKAVRMRIYKSKPAEKGSLSGAVLNIVKNKTYLYITGLLIIIGFTVFGIFSSGIFDLIKARSSSQPSVVTNLPELPKKVESVISLSKGYLEGDFDKYKFASFAPVDVYFYFEGFDIVALSKILSLNESIKPLFSKSDLLLEDAFAGFYVNGDQAGMVYVFVPTDADLVEKVLEDVMVSEDAEVQEEEFASEDLDVETEEEVSEEKKEESPKESSHKDFVDKTWFFKFLDGKLVMTTNEKLFSLVDETHKKTKQSLAVTSEFAKMRKELPTGGQLQVFFMHPDAKDFIRNSLGGLDQDTIAGINEVISSDFSSLIIR